MRDLEVTVKVCNNQLKQRRLELGLSQPNLAEAASVGFAIYQRLECLRVSPITYYQGPNRLPNNQWRWSEVALKLARFHCVAPEELFPDSVMSVEKPVIQRRMNLTDLGPLLSHHQQLRALPPDFILERTEIVDNVRLALSKLPPRDREIVRLVNEGKTLREIGKRLGISKSMVSVIDLRAKRRLAKLIKTTV